MIIRKANTKDIIDLEQLVNSAYRGEESKKGWTHEANLLVGGVRVTQEDLMKILTNDQEQIILVWENEKLRGCVNLKNAEDHLYLGMLTVSPSEQGKGYGKILLEEAEKAAQGLGLTRIKMTVISVRSELINWYKRHGYNDTGVRMPFPFQPQYGQPSQDLEFMVLEKIIDTN